MVNCVFTLTSSKTLFVECLKTRRLNFKLINYFGEVSFWPTEYIETDPRKISLFLISIILVSFRNCSSDRVLIIWMQFLFCAVKTVLEPDSYLQIYLSGMLERNVLTLFVLTPGFTWW
jgi:hypothetical protein